MANNFHHRGPVYVADIMGDVNNISNYYMSSAREMDQQPPTKLIKTDAFFSSTVPPRDISFKPIPEPHAYFVCRTEYVDTAIRYLSNPLTADVQIQFPFLLIHALGGYGKTQIARKIASLCRKEGKFQHFIWIDSGDKYIKKSFFEAIEQIKLNSYAHSTNFDSLVHQFYNLLVGCNHEKFLIIFDNVEDFDKILQYLPLNYRALNVAVLMTSQRPFTRQSYGKVNNQPLGLMPEKESMQLVDKKLGTSSMDSEQDKKMLVERSGRIILVLCVMTSTIKCLREGQSDYRIIDYLENIGYEPIRYSDEHNVLDLDLDYKKSLQTIVQCAIDKLKAIDGPIERMAVRIFDRAAYLSPTYELNEFIDSFLWDICDNANSEDLELPIKVDDNRQIIRMAIKKLSEFSLAELSYTFTGAQRALLT